MTFPILKDCKIKLEEGLELEFLVRNKVKLQDNQDYFILEDPNGTRHFIEAGFYTMYDFRPGEKIQCRIDRINCTGRVFLEPMHPFYFAGRLYDFALVSCQNLDGNIRIIIEDIFHNKIEMSVSGTISFSVMNKKTVKCEVIKIKKGIPEVDLVDYC